MDPWRPQHRALSTDSRDSLTRSHMEAPSVVSWQGLLIDTAASAPLTSDRRSLAGISRLTGRGERYFS